MTQTANNPTNAAIRNHRRGEITRWSRTLIPTARDDPAGAETPSHILLTRAGYIRQLAAGVYDYLPLAWRSLRKISDIIREELNAIDATEMLFPAFEPIELLHESGRDEAYGDDLFRVTDRHGRVVALAPTHEEPVVELARASITSYKQLPLSLYQIQTKFRDEPRPRAGLLRGREFIMKDAYSFHLAVEGDGGLDATYDDFYSAYSRIFARCGLDFTVVEAIAGPIGGSASHEFMVNCDSGEDTILVCAESGYAANVEKCEIGERSWSFVDAHSEPLDKKHTPKLPGIQGVARHLGLETSQMLKCIIFQPAPGLEADHDRPDWILAVVRGDHEVNEDKVTNAAGFPVMLAEDKQARAAGFAVGYVGPTAAAKIDGVRLLIDPDAACASIAWATGADENDHHVTGFQWTRDLASHVSADGPTSTSNTTIADLRNARAGDPSPRAQGGTLSTRRGIEVGHIFKLGTKYSDALGFQIMDATQKRHAVTMGCYGIGVSRTLAACVEMSHDDKGIVWPVALAPYHVHIVLMKPEITDHAEEAYRIATELADRGVDVLIDDRKERPGVKFKDADLIGMPIRVTIAPKAYDDNEAEFVRRDSDGDAERVKLGSLVDRVLSELAT